jgi:hypothetical protein
MNLDIVSEFKFSSNKHCFFCFQMRNEEFIALAFKLNLFLGSNFLCLVCFKETKFLESIFPIFSCLVTIRKVS